MAVVSRISTLQLNNSATTSSRTWVATAATQDTVAGSSVSVVITQSSSGAAPAVVADTLTLNIYIDSGTTLVRTISLTPASASQTISLVMASDGVTAASARAGTLRMRITAVNTTGGATGTYNADTDAVSAVPPTGFTITRDQGWVRSTTTASNALPGTGILAYNDTLTATTTLGAVPFQSSIVNVSLSPVTSTASAASTTVTFVTALGVVDNRFPASSASRTTALTFTNATLTATPWTTATLTETTRTVDPRITFSRTLQIESNTFSTPPSSNPAINTSFQRLTSQLGFLASRAVNANGTGIATLTWTSKTWDNGGFAGTEAAPAKTRTATATTQGGQAGWTDGFLTWDNQLPGGTWTFKQVILTPSNATGLELNNSESIYLLSINPLYRLVVGVGPSTTAADGDHWHAGDSLTVGLSVYSLTSSTLILPDTSPAPNFILGRFNLTLGRAEYLTNTLDVGGSYTWAALTGNTAYSWVGSASVGDVNSYVRVFTATETASWGDSDLFVIGIAYINGTPYNDFSFRDVLSKAANPHSAYTFDPTGLFK